MRGYQYVFFRSADIIYLKPLDIRESRLYPRRGYLGVSSFVGVRTMNLADCLFIIGGAMVGIGMGIAIVQPRVNALGREVNTLKRGILTTLDSLTFLHNRMDHGHTVYSVRNTLTNALADSDD